MFNFKYRYCKTRMVAYLNGELPSKSRRRVARYIDECSDCYLEYIRQRDLQQDLRHRLSVFGTPYPGQLDQIWGAIQDELDIPHRTSIRPWYLRYGLVTLVFMLVMLLPLTLLRGEVTSAVMVTQPTPEENRNAVITSAPPQPTSVAVATLTVDITDQIDTIIPEAVPQGTPRPGTGQ
jgi:anti-sigma factor RsiW